MGSWIWVPTEHTDDVGRSKHEDFAEGVVEREAGVVGRDDGGVACADEAEMEDARAYEVTFFSSSENEWKGSRRDGASGLGRLQERVEVDRAEGVPNCDEGVVLRDGDGRDWSCVFRCDRTDCVSSCPSHHNFNAYA